MSFFIFFVTLLCLSLYFEDNYMDVKLDRLIIWLDLSGGVFLIYGLIFQEEYFGEGAFVPYQKALWDLFEKPQGGTAAKVN